MISAIQLAKQGMTVQIQKQDQITNNLANMNTTGFKGGSLHSVSFDEYLENSNGELRANRVIRADEAVVDYSEGALEETGNPLDVAIHGSGFFTTLGADGIRYTRDGSFTLDRDGFLSTSGGDRLFGQDGFIRVDDGLGPVSILDNGDVVQDHAVIDRLKISDFNKPYKMLRVGDNSFRPKLPNNPVKQSEGYTIRQGFLETSNVDPISMMTSMITANRTYETIAKALSSQDSTLDKAVNQVGRVQ